MPSSSGHRGLEHVGSVALFLFDASGRGTPPEEQLHLLEEAGTCYPVRRWRSSPRRQICSSRCLRRGTR